MKKTAIWTAKNIGSPAGRRFTSNPCQNSRARTLQRTSEVAQKLGGAVHTPPPLGGGVSGSGYWIIYQSPHLQETTFDTLKGLGRGVSKHRLKEKNKLLFTKGAHPRAHTCHVIREAVYQQIKQTAFAKIKNRSNCPQPAPVWFAEPAILASVDTQLAPRKGLCNAGSGASLVAQWLRLQASTAGDMSSTPGRGTRSHMPQDAAKRKRKEKKSGSGKVCPLSKADSYFELPRFGNSWPHGNAARSLF